MEPDPRVDSARLTSAFYEQLRSSKDDFLLDGQELTMDHVNRLSTEPDDDADSFAHSKLAKDRGGMRSSYNTAGSDLLPLGSDDADTWDMPSPGPSTASFNTGTHTPLSHLDDESSATSLDGPTSKRARMQNGTPGSTRATMQSGGTPASTSSTARGPFTPAAARSSRQLPAPARSASRKQPARELPSRPETPQSTSSTPSNSRIPKPSPTYTSPNKALGGGSLPQGSPTASRIPRLPRGGPPSPAGGSFPGSGTAVQPVGGTAVQLISGTAADESTSGAAQGGRPMKPARDYGEKFSQMWGAEGQALQPAEATSQLPGQPSPSRIPSPSKAAPLQRGDDFTMTDAEDLPPSRIPPPPSPTPLMDPAAASLRSNASGDSNDSSTRSGGGKPWLQGGARGSGEDGEADIYTPTSQKRRDAMSPAELLLLEGKPSDRAEAGAFTQAMEADKATSHTPPVGPLTAAVQSQKQLNAGEASAQQQQAAAEHQGVGSRKHKRQNSNSVGPQTTAAGSRQPKCCGCSIM